MIEIEKSFKSKGFLYSQIIRVNDWAIYSQTKEEWKSKKMYYEVLKIIKVPDYTFPNGAFAAAHEAMPPISSWGSKAWSYTTLEDAMKKFDEMTGYEKK